MKALPQEARTALFSWHDKTITTPDSLRNAIITLCNHSGRDAAYTQRCIEAAFKSAGIDQATPRAELWEP